MALLALNMNAKVLMKAQLWRNKQSAMHMCLMVNILRECEKKCRAILHIRAQNNASWQIIGCQPFQRC